MNKAIGFVYKLVLLRLKTVLMTGLLSVLLTANLSAALAGPIQVLYPAGEIHDPDAYQWQLLAAAMKASGKAHDIRAVEGDFPIKVRRLKQILDIDNPRFTIFWAGTNTEIEQHTLPVRIPIMGGLLGMRLLLINKDNQPTFKAVNTLTDLEPLAAGQGLGWSDIAILEEAGIYVHQAGFEALFRMLDAQRIDFFPRGITEIYGELRRFQPDYPSLAVEESLAIEYPFAGFFFVSKNNPTLHTAVQSGLERMHADGSFQKLLINHPDIAASLEQAHLQDRRILRIDNPNMSPETLAIPEKYWFKPEWVDRSR